MAVYKRGGIWWYSFIFAGKRVQESSKTSRKTVAVESERARRRELERVYSGLPIESREQRIRSVSEMLHEYTRNYALNHRARSAVWARDCADHVERHLGSLLLPDVNERVVHDFIRARLKEGVCGRTINMDLGTLSRAMGKPWGTLWPNVRRLEERKDVGRALSPEEEARLLGALPQVNSVLVGPFIRIALMTGMRSGEIISLTWGQVDLTNRVITVGRAKTSSGTGRQIPMNQGLYDVLKAHAAWYTSGFGEVRHTDHLFPWGSPQPSDRARSATTIKTAWNNLRKKAKVSCRLHDMRHTAATKMAEAGVSEGTMLSLMGHMSRAMLERYSHIRLAAKREAVEALSVRSEQPRSEVVSTVSATVGQHQQIQ